MSKALGGQFAQNGLSMGWMDGSLGRVRYRAVSYEEVWKRGPSFEFGD